MSNTIRLLSLDVRGRLEELKDGEMGLKLNIQSFMLIGCC